ncbi:MAG: endonuclease/exonuclease/phosphatase family protein [Solirubrobacterales bacterium]|nr:endonuclease/exonuclease/phosphatase family protein [Solirubrobacterales bacterium]
MRLITWNLFHGRALPNAGRDLQEEFTAALAGWAWDVALLQEVPPWWPAAMGRACGASARSALTSRNALLPLRRLIARHAPDVIKSGGGGSNAILVRGAAITDHRVVVLRRRPERRVAHGVRLGDGQWVANLHAQVHSEAHAQADLATAAAALDDWAGRAGGAGGAESVILGGDTNTRRPRAGDLTVLGGHDVDFVLARGWRREGPLDILDRGTLSDHAPVGMTLARRDDSAPAGHP